jgi:hypothetical protein
MWWTQIAGVSLNDGLHAGSAWCAVTARCASSLSSYDVGCGLAGQQVALHLSAAKAALLVVHAHQVIKTLPRKRALGQGPAL